MQNQAEDIQLQPHWHVMYGRYATPHIIDELRRLQDDNTTVCSLADFFVPLQYQRDRKRQLTTHLVPGSYLFLKATKADILAIRRNDLLTTDIRFVRDANHPTMTISDHELNNFRNVIQILNDRVEYLTLNREMQQGDHVRIINGPFTGAEGILEARKGHQGGTVLVTLSNILATRTLVVPIEDIQYIDLRPVSRNYKRIKEFLQRSATALQHGPHLSAEEFLELRQLVNTYSTVTLAGKLRHTHAQAMCQALQALNMTGTTEYFKFRAILQE